MEKRKHLIITFGVIFGGLWLALMAYLLFGSRQSQQTAHAPQVSVTVRSASPILNNVASATKMTPRYGMKRLSYHTPNVQVQKPSYVPTVGGAAMHVYTTSNATMKSIGGGGNSGAQAAGNGAGSRQRTETSSALAYTGAIYMPRPRNAVTEVGAAVANEMASTVTPEPSAKPGLRKVGGSPEIPFPDPVGDVAWGLMALLALAYAGTLYYRKRRAV